LIFLLGIDRFRQYPSLADHYLNDLFLLQDMGHQSLPASDGSLWAFPWLATLVIALK
jgi:hypothetical protein